MKYSIKAFSLIGAALLLGACADESSSQPVAQDAQEEKVTQFGYIAKPKAPYGIDYRIIGTPVVGSQLTIELNVRSTLGPRPVTLDYRINDATAMTFAEAQPSQVALAPADNEVSTMQQVRVVPMREGRLYLNVSAAFQTDEGTMSTITAIPIQVGSGSRQLQQNGRVDVDENGEAIRVIEVGGEG